MFYYIIELTKDTGGIKFLTKTKEMLGELGIAGEMVVPTSARPVEELTQIGLEKGYSTIVAIGSARLVNKIAAILQNLHEVALGIVPTDKASPLHNLIGSRDVDSALQIIIKRQVKYVDLAVIEPNKFFLTKAQIFTPKPVNINFQIDDKIKGAAIVDEITIHSDLRTELKKSENEGFLKKITSTFTHNEAKLNVSEFFPRNKVEITTLRPLPVIIDKEIVAKTPIYITTRSQVLKIIANNDIIKPK